MFDLTGLLSEVFPRQRDSNIIWLVCRFCGNRRKQLLITTRGKPMCASCARRRV